ncbi:pentapeptide repeat-containing protein [Flavobacterium sp. RHBU_3]|uniref:pentapeptide repeat-containing protein n=1 Tax=Flavobacterium sp. RHBU_3 TaxID=3391184 RepID=UPI003984F325
MARQQINSQEDFENKFTRTNVGELNLSFRDTDFNIDIEVKETVNQASFYNCNFHKDFCLNTTVNKSITIDECIFEKEFDIQNSKFLGKARLQRCHFKGETYFSNSSFSDLADFWRSTFYKKTIFYKVDFNKTTVFSAATFKENVLFTYTLIEKLIIFRGTKVEKGFDLSLAIISGKIGLFNFNLKNYESIDKKITEDVYENSVSVTAEIPVKNKRETFRILKDNLESQKNLAESLEFKTIEKQILLKELWVDLNFPRFFDVLNLGLNWLSNKNGNSYGRAFLFTAGFGLLFFYFSLISLDRFSFTIIPSEWAFDISFRYFMEFLNPIHKFDYLGTETDLSKGFYVLDFTGKAFIGYGIYQFIQAFRKYK